MYQPIFVKLACLSTRLPYRTLLFLFPKILKILKTEQFIQTLVKIIFNLIDVYKRQVEENSCVIIHVTTILGGNNNVGVYDIALKNITQRRNVNLLLVLFFNNFISPRFRLFPEFHLHFRNRTVKVSITIFYRARCKYGNRIYVISRETV